MVKGLRWDIGNERKIGVGDKNIKVWDSSIQFNMIFFFVN